MDIALNALSVVALSTASAVVLAEQPKGDAPEGEGATTGEIIHVESVRGDTAAALDETEFKTVHHMDERSGETLSLAEVLSEGAGTHVRSLGGMGAFATLSIRGASPSHTVFSMDGIPLSRFASAVANIGRFEPASVATVEIRRSGGLGEFGSGAMAGSLNLVSRVAPSNGKRDMRLSLGGGSFGSRSATAAYLDRVGPVAVSALAAYRSANGDFRFFDDNGTNLNLEDDSVSRRSNNGFEQLDATVRVRHDRGLEAGSRTTARRQGVPGFASIQTEAASLSLFSELVDVHNRWSRDDGEWSVRGFGYLELGHYVDLDGEVGLGAQDRRYRSLSAGLLGGRVLIAGRHRINALADIRIDDFRETNERTDGGMIAKGKRPALGFSMEDSVRLFDATVAVIPSLRIDVLHTRPQTATQMQSTTQVRTDVLASPRLGGRWRLSQSLSLKSNVGLYYRAPTIFELFGDRGFIVGNPDLKVERGVSADLGFVAAPRIRSASIRDVFIELAGFYLIADDVIAMTANSGGFTGARNLDRARTLGVEAAGRLRVLSWLSARGAYTLLHSERRSPVPGESGKSLPGRPRHQLYARTEASFEGFDRLLSLWADVSMTSTSFLDAANHQPIPRRLLVGVGLKCTLLREVLAGLEVKNALDQRLEYVELDPAPSMGLRRVPRAIADVYGYPLPGRAYYLNLEMRL